MYLFPLCCWLYRRRDVPSILPALQDRDSVSLCSISNGEDSVLIVGIADGSTLPVVCCFSASLFFCNSLCA